jgi:hypothetical protein
MKTPIYILILINFFLIQNASANGIIVLEGHYQGENVIIQNAYDNKGVGFCVYEVKVNGKVTTDEINSQTFEISLTNLQLKVGESVLIKIKHKTGCKPQILNPLVLLPKSTYEVVSLESSGKGNFTWSTKNETGKLTYIIEQFRWNKWVMVGEVDGKGKETNNNYRFKITPHSGENKIRVKQIGNSGKPRYSESIKFFSNVSEVSFEQLKEEMKIKFSKKTMFEVYDYFGNILKKGFAEKINISDLKKGVYYLNYDNKTTSFAIND